VLRIPNVLEAMSPGGDVLPDAELVYSPTAADFDIEAFVDSASGYLSRYHGTMEDSTELGGAAIVQKVAEENSVNPRLLLALLELHSGWVYGLPANTDAERYPIGFRISDRTGPYQELMVAATQLSRGYYGWRLGTVVETKPNDGGTARWNPNAECRVRRRAAPVRTAVGNRPVDEPDRRPAGIHGAVPGDVRRPVGTRTDCGSAWLHLISSSRFWSCPSPPASAGA
jgi:hypothetical protein